MSIAKQAKTLDIFATIAKISAAVGSVIGLVKLLLFVYHFSTGVASDLQTIKGQNTEIQNQNAILKTDIAIANKTLEVVISQSGGLYWESGADGGTVKIGDELTAMTGHNPRDVMGMKWLDNYVHPDDKERVRSDIRQTILYKTDWSCVFRFYFETDRQYHMVKSDARRVLVNGQIVHYVGTIVPYRGKTQFP